MKLSPCNKELLNQDDEMEDVEDYDEDRCFPYKRWVLSCKGIPPWTGLRNANIKKVGRGLVRKDLSIPVGKKTYKRTLYADKLNSIKAKDGMVLIPR